MSDDFDNGIGLTPADRLKNEQAKHWALKVKMLAGELVDANELASSLGSVVVAFRSGLQNSPKKIAMALKNKYQEIDLFDAESIIEGFINEALEELGRFEPELRYARKRAIAKAADKSGKAEGEAESD